MPVVAHCRGEKKGQVLQGNLGGHLGVVRPGKDGFRG